MKQFEGKVALITGGTAGIGRATALAFAREGAKVVIAGRREKEGSAVADEIKRTGGEAILITTDVTREDDVRAMAARTVKTFGRLDYAFNNAGIEQAGAPLPEQTEEAYDRVMNTNVKGVWLAMKHEIPAMLKTGGGVIVNNSSVFGRVGLPAVEIYVASKHAVEGLTKAAALEYARHNIRVNAVAPGVIETPMYMRVASTPEIQEWIKNAHPVGRLGQPEEVAGAVLWLCSHGAAFVTGQTITVDGGFTAQ